MAFVLGHLGALLHVGCHFPGGRAEHSVQKLCCCAAHHGANHHCGDPADRDRSSERPEPEPAEHDSDSCAICQSYLASRDVTLPPPIQFVNSHELVQPVVGAPQLGCSAESFLGYSVRGPPQALPAIAVA